ncbi:MAG: hypothetical protein AAGA48_16015 [Myxococcota bacterium]
MSFDHAVVMGAGIAGHAAAAVLARTFQRVTVLEHDAFPEAVAPRDGVPQAHHVHWWLGRGDELLADLFPGLPDQLRERGGLRIDWSRDVRWHEHGVWKSHSPSDIESWSTSRALLEVCLRAELDTLPNVRLQPNTAAKGLVLDAEKRRVTGVDTPSGVLEADVVADCTGRNSPVFGWLEAAGIPAVPETQVHGDVVCATRQMLPRTPPEFNGLLQRAQAPDKRSAIAFAIEDRRWMVTLFGVHGEAPPDDDAEWRTFARALPDRTVAALIADCQPLTPVVRTTFRGSRWRRVERAKLPGRLVILGEALCSLNPLYGQGMTLAVLQAHTLGRLLQGLEAKDLDRALRKAPGHLAKVLRPAWDLAAREDFRHAETTGDRSTFTGLVNRYTHRLSQLAEQDAALSLKAQRVLHLQAPLTSLFDQGTVWKVLRGPSAPPTK